VAWRPPLCYAGVMTSIIRRTLTITIHESWTFVWTPGQTNDGAMEAEDPVALSPVALAQQLGKLLSLPAGANQADSPIQILLQYPLKESSNENTNP
jgi:hypothetical protein